MFALGIVVESKVSGAGDVGKHGPIRIGSDAKVLHRDGDFDVPTGVIHRHLMLDALVFEFVDGLGSLMVDIQAPEHVRLDLLVEEALHVVRHLA